MAHFTQLRSNVKGVRPTTLGKLTFITSGNRQGKTSVLDTIRLALTGYHPVGANPAALGELIPPGEEELFADLIMPGGSVEFYMEAPRGKAKRPKPVCFKGVCADWQDRAKDLLLLSAAEELSGLGAERMRRAVMTRFGALDEVPMPAALNPDQRALWTEACKATAKADVDPAAQLGEMQKWFKTRSKRWSDQAGDMGRAIESLEKHVEDIEDSEDVIDALKEQLAKAHAAEGHRLFQRDLDRAHAQLAEIKAKLASVKSAPMSTSTVNAHHDKLTQLQTRKATAETLLRLTSFGGDTCPLCKSKDYDAKALACILREAIAARKEDIRTLLDDVERRQREHQKATGINIDALRKQQAKCESTIEALSSVEVPTYSGPPAASIQEKLDAIRDAHAQRERIKSETKAMHALLDRSGTAKVLERQATVELTKLLGALRSTAESAVNRFMPDGFRAELRVDTSTCQWRMVGTDDRSHKAGAYSGSESGLLTVARACAWGEGAPFKLLLQDDVDLGVFDPEHLQRFYTKLEESVDAGLIDQVVLAWNRPDEAPTSDLWHVVNLGYSN